MICKKCNHEFDSSINLCPECGYDSGEDQRISKKDIKFINTLSPGAFLIGWIYFLFYRLYIESIITFALSAGILIAIKYSVKYGYIGAILPLYISLVFLLLFFASNARRNAAFKMGKNLSMRNFRKKETVITTAAVLLNILTIILIINLFKNEII